MTKLEINTLIEELIRIKDNHDLSLSERETINKACNVFEHNQDILTE